MGVRFTIHNAYRSIVRTPAVNLLIILSLGIGIGGATTVFGWVEHLVRRPLPAVNAMDRLVSVVTRVHGREDSVSYPDYLDWRGNASTLSSVAAFGLREFGVRASADQSSASQPVWGLLTTGNYFEALGITPASGRLLLPDDATTSG